MEKKFCYCYFKEGVDMSMRMSQEGLDKIVRLLKNVLDKSHTSSVMRISNPQYSSMYLDIFLDEAERNDDAIGNDDFAEQLWIRLEKDVNDYDKEATDFACTWRAWADLYRYLRKKGKLK